MRFSYRDSLNVHDPLDLWVNIVLCVKGFRDRGIGLLWDVGGVGMMFPFVSL